MPATTGTGSLFFAFVPPVSGTSTWRLEVSDSGAPSEGSEMVVAHHEVLEDAQLHENARRRDLVIEHMLNIIIPSGIDVHEVMP